MSLVEDEEDSQAGSSDNDADEIIAERDDGNIEGDGDVEPEIDNEDDNLYEEEEEQEHDEVAQNSAHPSLKISRNLPVQSNHFPLVNGIPGERHPVVSVVDTRVSNVTATIGTPASPNAGSRDNPMLVKPSLRPETLSAALYDIVPTIAAPHSTSINVVTATPDMRWVFTGGSDGWIRKFDWVDTANGKAMLTVAQRHAFVDSVTKAGVLMSYWENEETAYKSTAFQSAEDPINLSPVYSLAVHRQAVWLLSGTEGGAINVQSIRHEEGKRITSMCKHTSAVSVLSLSQDETSVLSGSWDKIINDWDLNTGQVKRSFTGSGGQISAIEMRPLSEVPIPLKSVQQLLSTNGATYSSNNIFGLRDFLTNDIKDPGGAGEDAQGSPNDSLFGGNGDVDHDSLFGDNDTAGAHGAAFDDEDDEFSRAIANGIQQQEKLEADHDTSMTDGVVCNSNENVDPGTDLRTATHQSSLNGVAASDPDMRLDHGDGGFSTNRFNDSNGLTDTALTSETIFLDAAIDGTIRIWDRRQPNPISKMVPMRGTPPWCMHACWSPDGNYIYAGRRNGTVDEYSLHKGLHEPERVLKFPAGSGAVSSVRAMPNGKHLLCASYDILRLYDLKDEESARHSKVPFLIVPGHRTGVVSQLYMDPTCTFVISIGGNRGWEGNSTEVLLGYEVGIGR